MRGISKAVDRASTSLMQKAGFAEKTVDRDFEDEEKRYRTLETKVSRLGKEAKGYLDSVRSLTIAAQRIADTINQFYDDSARLSTTAMCFKNSANELDESVRTALVIMLLVILPLVFYLVVKIISAGSGFPSNRARSIAATQ